MQGSPDTTGVLATDPGLHGGVDPAGPVGVDRDPGAGQLGGQVDRVSLQRGLSRGIGIAPDHAAGTGDDGAGDVDNAAPAASSMPGSTAAVRAIGAMTLTSKACRNSAAEMSNTVLTYWLSCVLFSSTSQRISICRRPTRRNLQEWVSRVLEHGLVSLN